MDIKHFYITVTAVFLVVCTVPASAFQGSMSITGSTELGGNITITCSWTLSPDEAFFNVLLRSLPAASGGQNYYYQFNQGYPWASPGSQNNSRMSYDSFNSSDHRAVVRITNVQCSDEQNYSCYFTTGKQGSLNINTEQTSFLTVRARPKTPSITLTPSGSTDILESSSISAVCASNVGRPGRGNLQWKVYRNTDPEVIQPSDPRLDALKNVSVPANEGNCTQRVEQTFRMQINRTDQNLTVACFVQNDDFQPQTPDKCENLATNLCAQTQSLRIVYGVNETNMNVDSNPANEVYQDKTLTLSCRAAGLPAPDYIWTLEIFDDNTTTVENNTFFGKIVDDNNLLVVSDLVLYVGQQLKYTCMASNTVLGQPYSATKEVLVQVLRTTTTAMPTTTKSMPTTPTLAGDSNVTKGASPQPGYTQDDPKNTIIIVVVVVGSILIIALIVGIIFWRRRRSKKEIEEPSEKPYNNRTNLSYQSSQPDLVADKKFTSPSLDSSFSEKKEDGLMYADLTYDNKPRSRKPMAITDSSSEYSDIQMPQV